MNFADVVDAGHRSLMPAIAALPSPADVASQLTAAL